MKKIIDIYVDKYNDTVTLIAVCVAGAGHIVSRIIEMMTQTPCCCCCGC